MSTTKLNWPTSIQGLGTPSATETDSPRNGTCRRRCDLAVVEILPDQEIEQEREGTQAADRPCEPWPPGLQVEPHEPDEGHDQQPYRTCPHLSAVPNSPGVSARIIHNSQNAKAAVATAVREKSRLAHAVRFLRQTSK